jgi:hypothetical protein
MKKIFGVAAGLGLVLASAIPVFALDSSSITGPKSLNLNIQAALKLSPVRTTNFGLVTQTVKSTATTGGNTSNKNTLSSGTGMADPTGNAAVGGVHAVQLNTADISVDQTGATCPCNTTGFGITGPKSVNVVANLDIKAASVTTSNFGVVNQTVTSTANSGNNESNGNTVGGAINTGSASVSENVQTILNTTTVSIRQ